MELLCPLCQNKLTVEDQFAGQLMKCPMCSGMFRTPALPEVPLAPLAPPSAAVASAPAPPLKIEETPPAAAAPSQPAAAQPATPAPSAPLPPLPDGFNHIYLLTFKQQIISWIAPVALLLIFIFSFFPWTTTSTVEITYKTPKKSDIGEGTSLKIKVPDPETESMWTTAIVIFIFYNVFYFFTLLFAVLAMLLDKKIITLPDAIKKMRRWRSIIVAGFAGAGLFALLLHWASTLNFFTPNANTVIFSLVLFLQFLVFVAPLLEYWLQQRKKDDLPAPRIEMHW